MKPEIFNFVVVIREDGLPPLNTQTYKTLGAFPAMNLAQSFARLIPGSFAMDISSNSAFRRRYKSWKQLAKERHAREAATMKEAA